MMEKAGKVKEKPAGAAIFLPRGRRSRRVIADGRRQQRPAGQGPSGRIGPFAVSRRPFAARSGRTVWAHPIGA